MLKSENVVKTYGSKYALDHVTFDIEGGHIYGLLGPNGSGKSTWMKMAAALIVPDSGEMIYEDMPVGTESKKYIAYMPTEPFFYSYMKIKDVGKYYNDFFEDFDMERYEQLISQMELDMDMKTKSLSSGMMAKLKIAVTLSRRARIYLLDEPLNGIALLAREDIIRAVISSMDENCALVISSHLVEELEKVIDRVVFMKDGHLAMAGDVEELRMNTGESVVELYKSIYGHHEV